MILNIIIAVVALVLGGLCGYFIFRYVLTGKYNEMISAAQKEAEVLKEKKKLEVKEIFLNKKSELEKEVQSRNQKIQQSENRLKQRELSLNQRQEELGRRKQDVDQQQQRVDNEKKLLQIKQEELDKMQLQERAKLEELSGLSAEEAKNRLVEVFSKVLPRCFRQRRLSQVPARHRFAQGNSRSEKFVPSKTYFPKQ